MTFSGKVERLMRDLGLTQEALGKALGVSQPAVAGWLSGAVPHRRRATELAGFLGVSVEVLLDDDLDLPPCKILKSSPAQLLSVAEEGPQRPYGLKPSASTAQVLIDWQQLSPDQRLLLADRIVASTLKEMRQLDD